MTFERAPPKQDAVIGPRVNANRRAAAHVGWILRESGNVFENTHVTAHAFCAAASLPLTVMKAQRAFRE
jgi:hypothetical protein